MHATCIRGVSLCPHLVLEHDLAVRHDGVHVDALLLLGLAEDRLEPRVREQQVDGRVAARVQHPVTHRGTKAKGHCQAINVKEGCEA